MTDIARRIPELDYFTWQQPVLEIKNDPPAAPSVGDRYLIGTGTGDWSGKDDNIAWYFDSSWNFTAPKDHMVVFNIDDSSMYRYEGSWTTYALSSDLTSAEIAQLKNIDTTTISNSQWGYLGAMSGQPLESVAVDDLTDANTSSPTAGELLIYHAGESAFKNASLTGGTNISISEANGSVTVNGDLTINDSGTANDELWSADKINTQLASKQDSLTFSTGLSEANETVTTNDSQIDHNSLSNTHNLTTDIDHNSLNNYSANEHRIWENSITQDIHDDNITSSSVTQHEADLSITEDQISDFGTYQPTSEKGSNNGYAGLDAGGKVPIAQLPDSIIEYQGTWNANTNDPTLADGTGNTGDVYKVSTGGTQNLGSGDITFAEGDWAMYNGSIWEKSINSNAVVSVNSQTGVVSLDLQDVSSITSDEETQLANINSVTISNDQWGYLGAMTGQPLESIAFNDLSDMPGGDITVGNITVGNGNYIGISASDERIVFDSTNGDIALMATNVGIGTAAPDNRLTVAGDADFMYNVGIGTTSPKAALDLALDNSDHNFVIGDADGLDSYASLIGIVGAPDTNAMFEAVGTSPTGANAFRLINDVGTRLTFSMWGSGRTPANTAFVKADTVDTGVDDPAEFQFRLSADSPMTFYTNDTERVRIQGDGNVGIGTNSPDEKLEVNGNIYLQDNDKSLFGTGKDASIYYDGTDLIINPAEVGSGVVSVSGDVEVTDDAFAADWDADTAVPTKNAIYDAIRRKGFAAKNSTTSMSAFTWTVPTFTTEIDDTDNAWDGTTFTVPAGMGGMWSISGMFTFAHFGDGKRYIVGVEVNGGVTPSYTFLLGRGMNGGSERSGVGGNVRWELDAGDTVRMVVYCGDATSGYNSDGYQSFSAYKLND